jgi:GMP synthase-like glutamine amidotransferase
MPTKRIHIAVLDTDVPMPTVYAARGLYSSQFRLLLQRAAERINSPSYFSAVTATDPYHNVHPRIEIHTTAYDVVGGSFPPLQILRKETRESESRKRDDNDDDSVLFPGPIDAILITGSAASVYQSDKYPWIRNLQSFTQTVFRSYPAVKIFGSCFGHQLVAQALLSDQLDVQDTVNGKINKSPSVWVEACPQGYEVGIFPIRMNPEFMDHFPILRSSLVASSRSTEEIEEKEDEKEIRIQLVHGDRVIAAPLVPSTSITDTDRATSPFSHDALPLPWLNIGSTAKSPIQGLFLPNRLLTYQGHFEFDAWMNRETCIEFARRAGWDAGALEGYLEDIARGRKQIPILDRPEDALDYGDSDDDDAKLAAEVVVMFFAGITPASSTGAEYVPPETDNLLFPSTITAQAAVDPQPQKLAMTITTTAILCNGQITPPLNDH